MQTSLLTAEGPYAELVDHGQARKGPDVLNVTVLGGFSYGDYLRGNYDLAVLGFRQYLDSFPNTELADNATYWIGESYFSQRKFRHILTAYPRSDKVASALLKKAYAFLELGDRSQGTGQLQTLIRQYPGTDEANLAKQRLDALGVDAG